MIGDNSVQHSQNNRSKSRTQVQALRLPLRLVSGSDGNTLGRFNLQLGDDFCGVHRLRGRDADVQFVRAALGKEVREHLNE